jgi:hypothetical protein
LPYFHLKATGGGGTPAGRGATRALRNQSRAGPTAHQHVEPLAISRCDARGAATMEAGDTGAYDHGGGRPGAAT